MECPFRVGDRVICVDARQSKPRHKLVHGNEYVIRWVGPRPDYIGGWPYPECTICIRVEGIKRKALFGLLDVPLAWKRFRPVQEQKQSDSKRRYVDPQRFKKLLDIAANPNKHDFRKKADEHEKVRNS